MGWMELLVVGVVALIVVGPKDLPVMFQALGKMTAKVKRMAREFQSAMSDAADATGAADLSKELKGLTSPRSLGIDKLKEAADSFDKWEPGKASKKAGPETTKLAADRAEASKKIREKTAEVAQARLDKEALESAGAKPETPAPSDTPAKTEANSTAKAKPKAAAKPKSASKSKTSTTPKTAAKPKTAVKPTAKAAGKPKA